MPGRMPFAAMACVCRCISGCRNRWPSPALSMPCDQVPRVNKTSRPVDCKCFLKLARMAAPVTIFGPSLIRTKGIVMTEPVFWRGQAGPVPATSCGVGRNGFASFIRLFSTCGLLALLCGGAPLHAQTGDPQVRYAIESTRAASSLLLDVTHAGERLVAAGDRGHILYSDDGGASWTQAKVPTRQLLTAIYFTDAQHGWAVGHDALVLASTDGGQTRSEEHTSEFQ